MAQTVDIFAFIIQILPYIVQLIELLMKGRSGPEKRTAAVTAMQTATPHLSADLLGAFVDGTVSVLNLTTWVDTHGTKFSRPSSVTV